MRWLWFVKLEISWGPHPAVWRKFVCWQGQGWAKSTWGLARVLLGLDTVFHLPSPKSQLCPDSQSLCSVSPSNRSPSLCFKSCVAFLLPLSGKFLFALPDSNAFFSWDGFLQVTTKNPNTGESKRVFFFEGSTLTNDAQEISRKLNSL
jgi:hypothetical protein